MSVPEGRKPSQAPAHLLKLGCLRSSILRTAQPQLKTQTLRGNDVRELSELGQAVMAGSWEAWASVLAVCFTSSASMGKSFVPLSCSFLICHIHVHKTTRGSSALEVHSCLKHRGCKPHEKASSAWKVRGKGNGPGGGRLPCKTLPSAQGQLSSSERHIRGLRGSVTVVTTGCRSLPGSHFGRRGSLHPPRVWHTVVS